MSIKEYDAHWAKQLLPYEMEVVTRVQILDEVVCVSLRVNALLKAGIYLFIIQWHKEEAWYLLLQKN